MKIAIMRRYYEEAWKQGNLDVLDEFIGDEYVNDSPAFPVRPGVEGVKAIMRVFRAAFPDQRFMVEDLLADGDRIATRWTFRGT
jgi:predicted ester cyclase